MRGGDACAGECEDLVEGFGRQWAEVALERGDQVAATARDIRALDPLVDTYRELVLPIQLDVTDRDGIGKPWRAPPSTSADSTSSSTTPVTDTSAWSRS
jgi:hypothetical protein